MPRVHDGLSNESAARFRVVKRAAQALSLEAKAILTNDGATAPHSTDKQCSVPWGASTVCLPGKGVDRVQLEESSKLHNTPARPEGRFVAERVMEVEAALLPQNQNARSCPRLAGAAEMNKSPRKTFPSKGDSPRGADPEMPRYLWRPGKSEGSSREGSPNRGSTVHAQLSTGLLPPTQVNMCAANRSHSSCSRHQQPGWPLQSDLSAASTPIPVPSRLARALNRGSWSGHQ